MSKKVHAKDQRSPAMQEAIADAYRFLDRVQTLEAVLTHGPPGTNPAHYAAVRRTSMDLTRSLAKLRKRGPRWYDF